MGHSTNLNPLVWAALVCVAWIFSANNAITAQGCIELDAPLTLFTVASETPSCSPTSNKESAVFLELNAVAFRELSIIRPDVFEWALTFPSGEHVVVELHRFQVHSDDLEIGHMTDLGLRIERYQPELLSYRFVTAGVRGTLIVSKDQAYGVVRMNGVQHELAALRCTTDGASAYALFDVADAIIETPFSCGMEELESIDTRSANLPAPQRSSKQHDRLRRSGLGHRFLHLQHLWKRLQSNR